MVNKLQLYRKGVPTVIIPIDENTVYYDECMGRFDIHVQFFSENMLDIRTDDYFIFNGIRWTINVPYQITRNAVFEYNITFEHPSYWLKDIQLKHLGTIEFSYFGSPAMFANLIVENMNVDDSGWKLGICETMDEINIDFYASGQGYSCKGALQYVSEKFQLEYWFSGDGKTINITKQAGNETNIHFAYGRTKGLYTVERGILETPLYNRIYGFGGTTNLKQTYRGGAKRLTFDAGYLQRELAEGERRRETSVVLDDIFPQRTSSLTAVNSDRLTLSDTTIDFDLNGNRIEGQQAKIVLKTGELSGQEFEISSYNHSNKTIKIKANTDGNDYTLPNATFSPKIGDKYTLIGVDQPKSYVDDAEKRLKEAVLNSFKKLTRPPYMVDIDEKYMRENAFSLKSGDRVRLTDEKLGIDDLIRVTSVSFPMVNPNLCTVVISDTITYTQEVQLVIDQGKIKEEVKQVDRSKAEQQRVAAMRMRQLQTMIFDPDGYFDGSNIKPNSIETLMLSVGAKSQNFYLDGVRIEIDINTINVSPGQLVHKEIQIEGLGYVWEIGGYVKDDLEINKSYYLSAKCSKSSLVGQWFVSETPMTAESEAGYYHFNIGVIYDVFESRRDYSFTNGMTYINGDTITTGKIKANRIDVDGLFAQLIEVGSNGFTNAGISGLADGTEIIDGIEIPSPDKSQRFWAGAAEKDRYEAPFQVLNDGSMKASKGKIGGFELTEYSLQSKIIENGSGSSSPSSGIIFSDWGVLSRNAGMSFLPASTGLDFSGSLVGEASVLRPNLRPAFTAEVRAGVIGIRRQDLSTQALDLLWGAWGRYGAMFSSVKFLGAIYEAVRIDNSNTDTYLTEFDYFVAKGGSNTNIFLPTDAVEIGRTVIIKNATGSNISVNGNGFDIYRMDNTPSNSSSLVKGGTYKYRCTGNQWIETYG